MISKLMARKEQPDAVAMWDTKSAPVFHFEHI